MGASRRLQLRVGEINTSVRENLLSAEVRAKRPIADGTRLVLQLDGPLTAECARRRC